MNNENSTSNAPRKMSRVRRGSVAPSGRSRKFSCITYLPQVKLELCLLQHMSQIRCYAYAYHDKDKKEDGTLKEPHFHLVIVTHNTCSISSIRRWFSGYVDEKGMDITTTAQICTDVFQMYDYLTHSTKEARAEEKYQYDKSIVITNDFDYFAKGIGADDDNILLATESLLKGAKVRDVGKRYGRDFILHYNTIKSYVNDVQRFEKYNMTLEDIVDREYDLEIIRLNGGVVENGK